MSNVVGYCLDYNCEYRRSTGSCSLTAGCVKRTSEFYEHKTNKTPTLKPCPFCGGSNSLSIAEHPQEGFGSRYSILCDYREGGCGADGPWYHSPEEAAWAWNRRA